MTRSFLYPLEDFPLLLEAGLSAGLISGAAEINYFSDGEWGVESIRIDVDRRATEAEYALTCKRYVYNVLHLDRGTPLFSIIHDRLENEYRDAVQEAVREQIAIDRECAADDRADARRDEMMLGEV